MCSVCVCVCSVCVCLHSVRVCLLEDQSEYRPLHSSHAHTHTYTHTYPTYPTHTHTHIPQPCTADTMLPHLAPSSTLSAPPHTAIVLDSPPRPTKPPSSCSLFALPQPLSHRPARLLLPLLLIRPHTPVPCLAILATLLLLLLTQPPHNHHVYARSNVPLPPSLFGINGEDVQLHLKQSETRYHRFPVEIERLQVTAPQQEECHGEIDIPIPHSDSGCGGG